MSELYFFKLLVESWIGLAFIVFLVLLFLPAPYGRYNPKRGWSLPDSWGWVVMELPAILVFGSMFLIGAYRQGGIEIIFFLLWMTHYVQRAFIYPFTQRKSQRRMPFYVVGMGFLFNVANGYLNGRYLFEFSGGYPNAWLKDWRFLLGVGLFIAGFFINREADRILRELRGKNHHEYEIPYKGMFRWISCPNYFGEMLLWVGWAIATWSISGLAFALWTIANLAPRARSHHKWYHEQFNDYPPKRRALLPGIW